MATVYKTSDGREFSSENDARKWQYGIDVGLTKLKNCHLLTLGGGDIYVGQSIDGRANGRGILFKEDGSIRDGYFENHRFIGDSPSSSSGGGNFTGRKEVKLSSGNGYMISEGDFVNDIIRKGKLTLLDKQHQVVLVHEGNFNEDGIPHGKCKRTEANGDVYEGDWVNGEQHGKGKMTYANGSVYEGDFVNGELHGKGKITFESGNVYEGDFANDKYNGKGKMTYANGSVYEGDFVDDNFHGKGKMIYPNGDVYEGDFADDDFNGKGKYTFANGDVFEGVWEDGTGTGKMTFANGKVKKGVFDGDEFEED